MSVTKPLIVKCPQCFIEHEWSSDHLYRPFCSERCKQIDLGAWASERYQIAGTEVINQNDDSSPQYPQ